MASPEKFVLTTHAVDRLFERHPRIFARPYTTHLERYAAARRVFNDAKEDKSFRNNTEFAIYLGEKYGYDIKHHLFRNGNVLFIGMEKSGRNVIATVIDARIGTWGRRDNTGGLRPRPAQS